MLPLALHRLQRNKLEGGYNLFDLYSKFLTFKLKLFNRLRNSKPNDDFVDYIFSIISQGKDPSKLYISSLFSKKKIPNSWKGFPRYLFLCFKLLNISSHNECLTFCSDLEIFSNAPLYIQNNNKWENLSSFSTKELAYLIHDKLHPNSILSSRQLKLISFYPSTNFQLAWKTISKLKCRSIIKLFLLKIWNVILFLPNPCNCCLAHYEDSPTHHFLNCEMTIHVVSKILNLNLNPSAFLSYPSIKNITLYALLFTHYSYVMKTHYNNLEFQIDDILPLFLEEKKKLSWF
jgi:hypothetical protein